MFLDDGPRHRDGHAGAQAPDEDERVEDDERRADAEQNWTAVPSNNASTIKRPRLTMLPMRLMTIEEMIEPLQNAICIEENCSTSPLNSSRRMTGSDHQKGIR